MYDMVGGDIFLVKDRQLCRVAPKGRDPSCFRACFSSREHVFNAIVHSYKKYTLVALLDEPTRILITK